MYLFRPSFDVTPSMTHRKLVLVALHSNLCMTPMSWPVKLSIPVTLAESEAQPLSWDVLESLTKSTDT